MKLIDLLVQELPKRGGWPEGAVKAVSYSFIPGVHFWDDNELRVDYSDLTTRALGEGLVTREQYDATGWDGTGLPPVGVECEWQDKNTGQWQPVKIVYASEWVTVVREINEEKGDDLVEIALENYGDDARLKFRPLRTEAERAIDEMVRLSGVSIGAAKILYDAGYRK